MNAFSAENCVRPQRRESSSDRRERAIRIPSGSSDLVAALLLWGFGARGSAPSRSPAPPGFCANSVYSVSLICWPPSCTQKLQDTACRTRFPCSCPCRSQQLGRRNTPTGNMLRNCLRLPLLQLTPHQIDYYAKRIRERPQAVMIGGKRGLAKAPL